LDDLHILLPGWQIQHVSNRFVENIGVIDFSDDLGLISDDLRPVSDGLRSASDPLNAVSDALTLAGDGLEAFSRRHSAFSQPSACLTDSATLAVPYLTETLRQAAILLACIFVICH
jgi:hypothetical protein